jgi:signal transduction histidine kinase
MPLNAALSILPAAVPTVPAANGLPGVGAFAVWSSGLALAGWAYVVRLRQRMGALAARARDADARMQAVVQAAGHQARMVAAVSHDLRQPLAAAGVHASLMQRRLQAGQVRQAGEQAARVTAAIVCLDQTLEHLLEAARADAGIDRIEPVPQPLLPILERVRDEYRVDAARAGLRLGLRIAEPAVVVVTDAQALYRVLANLLSNAIRCTGLRRSPGHGVMIRVACEKGAWCRIDVTDSGPGIAPERLESIWEPSAADRLHPAGFGTGRNLGLGLYLVRRLVGLLPGHLVSVRSRPGRGTRFRIMLPVRRPRGPSSACA